jgi:dTMP kinase
MAPATIKDLATAATEVASRVLPLTNSPSSQNAPVQATEISQATTTDRMEAITPTTPTPTTARQDDAGGDAGTARGALIVLEGLDRSGKTTQVKLLEQRFVEVGRRVKVMRFPGMSLFSLPLGTKPGMLNKCYQTARRPSGR